VERFHDAGTAPRIACGADELAIDELTARFFTTFTNRNGVIPDFDRFDERFIPEATLVKNVGGMPVVYDVASFLEPRKTILTDGTVREFSEYETSAQTHVYGNIAQRFSRYKKLDRFGRACRRSRRQSDAVRPNPTGVEDFIGSVG